MKFNPNRRGTGICRICGKSTKVNIHQACYPPVQKAQRKLTERNIKFLQKVLPE